MIYQNAFFNDMSVRMKSEIETNFQGKEHLRRKESPSKFLECHSICVLNINSIASVHPRRR